MSGRKKISINKLAEYNRCPKSARRTKIIREAKFADDQKFAPYYGLIRIPVLDYLITGDISYLDKAIEAINARVSTDPDEFAYKDNRASKAAIASVKKIQVPNLTRGGSYLEKNNRSGRLGKSGINITVKPEILIHDKSGEIIGGIKMHYTKKPKIEDESMKDIGHMLHQFLEQEYATTIGLVKRSKCYCIDVSTQRVLAAPASFVAREKDLVQSCLDIATLWTSVVKS